VNTNAQADQVFNNLYKQLEGLKDHVKPGNLLRLYDKKGNDFYYQRDDDSEHGFMWHPKPPDQTSARGGRIYYERVPLKRYAKGGAVGKLTKQAANYRDSAEDNRFCARCRMYRDENKCTLVAGPVHRVGLCDYYEKA
jgi:hypothetical protein